MQVVPSTPKKPNFSRVHKQFLRTLLKLDMEQTDQIVPRNKKRKASISSGSLFRANAVLKGAYSSIQTQMDGQGGSFVNYLLILDLHMNYCLKNKFQ